MTDNVHPLALEAGPTRLATINDKIKGSDIGFKGSVFLHIDFDPKTKRIHGLRLSEKSKDGSALDKLLHQIGDKATSIINHIQGSGQ